MRFFSFSLLFIFSLSVALAQPASAACSKKLIIGYSDWHRGSHDFDTEKKFKIDLELSERILKETGCDFEHRPLPMLRLLRALEAGEIDATMAASLTPDRQTYAWFSVPYRHEKVVMFMRKEDADKFWPVNHIELATSGYRVGMGIGAWYGPEFKALLDADPEFNASILRSDKLDIVFDWLLQKRVDIVVNELYTGLYQLQLRNALGTIAAHSFIINSDPVHFMLSQASTKLEDVRHINSAIKTFRGSKEYARILATYRSLAEQ